MISRTEYFKGVSTWFGGFLMAVAFLFGALPEAKASDASDAQGIVDTARVTFNGFMNDPNYSWIHNNLKNAKGVLIFPQVLKAGFFFGGSGGTGVLLARDPKTGDWSQPAFYTIGSISFGLQIGGEAAEVIMMLMSERALDSLYVTSLKLGGDTSIALGPIGAGAQGEVTADVVSFAKSKGLYAGLNLQGSAVTVRDSLNNGYYGKNVTPVQIIVEKTVNNKGAAELRDTLKKAAAKP